MVFAGNLLLAHPDIAWTIHVLCGHLADERSAHFIQCMNELMRRGVNIDMTVTSNLADSSSVPCEDEWYDIAVDQICMYNTEPDVVFTHNRRGDYGHPLHCVTNYAVTSIFDNVWEFLCPVKSGAGPNWEGARYYSPEPHSEAKREILLAVYPEECEAIRRDRPGLYQWMMQGEETFTSQGTLPW